MFEKRKTNNEIFCLIFSKFLKRTEFLEILIQKRNFGFKVILVGILIFSLLYKTF